MFGFGNKKRLLDWQNTLLEEPVHKLIMNERQLIEYTQYRLDNDLRIINDCIKITESTTKPDVFFPRLQLLKECAEDMVKFEGYMQIFGAKPSEALKEYQDNKQQCIKQFVIRYFCSVFDKAETLKTDKGKFKQYQKFYDSMQPYYEIMDAENIDYVETKYKAYTRYIKGQ